MDSHDFSEYDGRIIPKGARTMKKSYESIEALRQKTGVTFEQADRALAKARGDADLAAYYLMRSKAKAGEGGTGADIWDRIAGIFLYTLRVERRDRVFLHIPVWIVYLLLIITNIFTYRGYTIVMLGFLTVYVCALLSRASVHIEPPLRCESRLTAVETGVLPPEEAMARYPEEPVSESADGEHTVVVE
jgi:hypothetical protein